MKKKLLRTIIAGAVVIALGVWLFKLLNAPKHTKAFTLSDIQFEYAGPLFQGSNPAQYVAKIDLKEILGSDYKAGIKIKNAVLKNATVESFDPSTFQDVSALVVSFASDNPDLSMQELAVINPKPEATRINKPPVDSRRKKSSSGEMRDFMSLL